MLAYYVMAVLMVVGFAALFGTVWLLGVSSGWQQGFDAGHTLGSKHAARLRQIDEELKQYDAQRERRHVESANRLAAARQQTDEAIQRLRLAALAGDDTSTIH